jgi:hypothetical protein
LNLANARSDIEPRLNRKQMGAITPFGHTPQQKADLLWGSSPSYRRMIVSPTKLTEILPSSQIE